MIAKLVGQWSFEGSIKFQSVWFSKFVGDQQSGPKFFANKVPSSQRRVEILLSARRTIRCGQ